MHIIDQECVRSKYCYCTEIKYNERTYTASIKTKQVAINNTSSIYKELFSNNYLCKK